MPKRTHPLDAHISNGKLAEFLIFFTRHHIPFFSRVFTAFLNCDIGRPLPKTIFLPHPFGIVLSGGCELGDDVVIGQQVTIGNRNGVMAAPKIGNRVYIGAGAKILGNVTIGDNVVIGANAVITRDVPQNLTAVGANRLLPLKNI